MNILILVSEKQQKINHEQIKIYFSRIGSVLPRVFFGIPVYITTVHFSGTEEPSLSCNKLPHKHSFTVHIIITIESSETSEIAGFCILMAVSSLYSKH